MQRDTIRQGFQKVPRELRIFLAKALVIFVVWQALYHGFLIRTGFPNNGLTRITAYHTADVLRLTGINVVTQDDGYKVNLLYRGVKIIGIADPCNALEIYVLYVAFLFCYPSATSRRIGFAAVGIPILYGVNVLRCVFMTYINFYFPSWSDISHHYIFTTIVYLIVFLFWMAFTRETRKH